MRRARLSNAKKPVQRVRKPAFGVKLHHAPDAVRAARLQFLHRQIHRRPPARQIGSVPEHIGHFFERAPDSPMRDEVIIVSAHLAVYKLRASRARAASPRFSALPSSILRLEPVPRPPLRAAGRPVPALRASPPSE